MMVVNKQTKYYLLCKSLTNAEKQQPSEIQCNTFTIEPDLEKVFNIPRILFKCSSKVCKNNGKFDCALRVHYPQRIRNISAEKHSESLELDYFGWNISEETI